MRFLKFCVILFVTLLLLESNSCKVHYNFNSGRQEITKNDTLTVSVLTFENNAPLAKATLPQTLTESLKDALQRQTRMTLVTKNGDLNYEGTITGYAVTPVSIQAGGTDQAAQNRLTITVKVKYTDGLDDKYSFESNFSRYADFPSTQNLSQVEDQLIQDITDQLVQDIMSKSVNAW